MDLEHINAVDRHWSARDAANRKPQPSAIVAHVNKRICGVPVAGAGVGLQNEIRRRYAGRQFGRAVSIGAGLAAAEMELLAAGIVGHFHIFELATERINKARSAAEKRGLAERITFHNSDAFSSVHEDYDLVYWRNSLHHMPDTNLAVAWSKEVLAPGGLFAMQEYTGPDRLQYTNRQMSLCNRALSLVPDSYFTSKDGKRISRKCKPPSQAKLMQRDPSEACDSASIMPAVAKHFPNASIINVGGLIYFAGLRRILHNFLDGNSPDLLSSLLEKDEELADSGESLFHVVFAQAG